MRYVKCEICSTSIPERRNYDVDGYPKIPHINAQIADRIPLELREDLLDFDGYAEWDICLGCFKKILRYAKELKEEKAVKYVDSSTCDSE